MRRSLMLAFAAVCACGNGDTLSPVGFKDTTPDAGTTGGAGSGATGPDGGGSGGGGPVKRTVEQRNPYGNVKETHNLLWDGDFEWSSPFSDEYGWLAYPPPDGFSAFPWIAIGAACRSGIKCALVPKGKSIIAIGVASIGSKLEASFWARPKAAEGAAPSCEKITAVLMSEQSIIGAVFGFQGHDPDDEVPPLSRTPDEAGWCRFEAVVAERSQRMFLYLRNSTGQDLVIDDAVLRKAPASQALSLVVGPRPTKELVELDDVRRFVRARGAPHDPPPNAARRALESWAKR